MCVTERGRRGGEQNCLGEGYGIGCAGITSHASLRSPRNTAACPMGVHDAKQMSNVKK